MSTVVEFYQQRIIQLQSDLATNAEIIDHGLEVHLGQQASTDTFQQKITVQHQLLQELSINITKLGSARDMVNSLPSDLLPEQHQLLTRILEWYNSGKYEINRHNVGVSNETLQDYLLDLLNSIQTLEVIHQGAYDDESLNELGPAFSDMTELWQDAVRLFPSEADKVREII
jgi:hypothetical protein